MLKMLSPACFWYDFDLNLPLRSVHYALQLRLGTRKTAKLEPTHPLILYLGNQELYHDQRYNCVTLGWLCDEA